MWLMYGLSLLILSVSTPSVAQEKDASIDPKADSVLRQMSDYMDTLEQFTVRAENGMDTMLPSGQTLQLGRSMEISVRRPDRLRGNINGGRYDQEFYYDGKTLTLYQEDQNCYATIEAPPTIEETLDFTREDLELYCPGGDLLYRNLYSILTEDVISGSYVGMSVVGGTKCHHLAFRGNEVDWQIWIEGKDRPLPKKFIVTSKWVTGAPQFTLIINSWDLSPEFTKNTFTFEPPKDAHKIDFIRLTSAGDSQR